MKRVDASAGKTNVLEEEKTDDLIAPTPAGMHPQLLRDGITARAGRCAPTGIRND